MGEVIGMPAEYAMGEDKETGRENEREGGRGSRERERPDRNL